MAELPELFKTAPAEVQRYFQAKRSLPTFDWRDIAPEEHAFSWTVAKSAGFDVLDDIREAVNDAIVNRVPLEEFRDRLTPILQAKGWWGRKIAVDPQDDRPIISQLGSPRRLKTIYWANMRTAHGAGEWDRTQRNKAFLPFLVYTLSVAERRRVEHQGWVGIVLPVDHPFWNTHYPPNGWGCKCGVRQISRGEAVRLGWKEGQTDPLVIYQPWHNKRTGETIQVPAGIDPGWATNPGKTRGRNVARFLYEQVEAMPAYRQEVAIADIVGSPILNAMVAGKARIGTFLPVVQLPVAAQEAAGADTRLVRLSTASVQHIIVEHAERQLTVSDFRTALQVARQPAGIIKGGRSLVLLGEVGGNWWRVTVKSANEGREWWLVSFHIRSAKRALSAIAKARANGDLVE